MRRAHKMALRAHRADFLPAPLTKSRVLLALMRWFFNAQVHGLVRLSGDEAHGQQVLQDGLRQRAAGEKLVADGLQLLAQVDSYRDDDQQLNVATLGVKKITELGEMLETGELQVAQGKQLVAQAQQEILRGRGLLPHVPRTKRMLRAIRAIYKVVQTKDYIDQMDPDLRAILLEGDAASALEPSSIYDQL